MGDLWVVAVVVGLVAPTNILKSIFHLKFQNLFFSLFLSFHLSFCHEFSLFCRSILCQNHKYSGTLPRWGFLYITIMSTNAPINGVKVSRMSFYPNFVRFCWVSHLKTLHQSFPSSPAYPILPVSRQRHPLGSCKYQQMTDIKLSMIPQRSSKLLPRTANPVTQGNSPTQTAKSSAMVHLVSFSRQSS